MFCIFKKILPPSDLKIIKNSLEKDIILFHSTLGRWMRNNFNLWTDGPLKKYFKNLGLWHSDDMSGLILKYFHRKLNDLPLDIKAEVAYYQNYWATNYPDAQKEAEDFQIKL